MHASQSGERVSVYIRFSDLFLDTNRLEPIKPLCFEGKVLNGVVSYSGIYRSGAVLL